MSACRPRRDLRESAGQLDHQVATAPARWQQRDAPFEVALFAVAWFKRYEEFEYPVRDE